MLDLRDYTGLAEQIVIDTSEQQPAYLLITRSGRYLRLAPSAYLLLRELHAGRSFDEIAAQISERSGTPTTPEEVETACQHVAERIATIEQTPQAQIGFWKQLRLLPASLVAPIASHLSRLFDRGVVVGALAVFGMAIVLTIMHGRPSRWGPELFWAAYTLFLLSLVAHEFGHASACARYGAPPGEIGCTLYWIYPALYSDVSAAWRLRRWQRVVVDLGGVFFQMIVGAVYVALYQLFGWEAPHLAFLMILYSVAFSLNPILKFDGYWLLSDAFGVTNLGRQPRRMIRYLWGLLRGQQQQALPWSGRVIAFVIGYTLICLVFWGYFTWRIVPFAWHALTSYPLAILSALSGVIRSPQQVSLKSLGSLSAMVFVLCLSVLMIVRLLRAPLLSLLGAVMGLVRRQLHAEHEQRSTQG